MAQVLSTEAISQAVRARDEAIQAQARADRLRDEAVAACDTVADLRRLSDELGVDVCEKAGALMANYHPLISAVCLGRFDRSVAFQCEPLDGVDDDEITRLALAMREAQHDYGVERDFIMLISRGLRGEGGISVSHDGQIAIWPDRHSDEHSLERFRRMYPSSRRTVSA